MEKRCTDPIFGDMRYNHRWYKKEKINLFNRQWDITVAAKAYSQKPITNEQQKSYSYFCDNIEKLINEIENNLKEYINLNLQQLETNWIGARVIDSSNDLAQIVTPKTLLFKQDGTIILLLDCIWDKEHGVAVKVWPNFEVGIQDLFL